MPEVILKSGLRRRINVNYVSPEEIRGNEWGKPTKPMSIQTKFIRAFLCKECGQTFPTMEELDAHEMQTDHNYEMGKY